MPRLERCHHAHCGRTHLHGGYLDQPDRSCCGEQRGDASAVTYLYAMDGGTSAAGTGMDVTTGVHTVNIVAVWTNGDNTATVGGYLARVDKQQPATPAIKESVSASGTGVLLTLTFQTDPRRQRKRQTHPAGWHANGERRWQKPTYTAAKTERSTSRSLMWPETAKRLPTPSPQWTPPSRRSRCLRRIPHRNHDAERNRRNADLHGCGIGT